MRRAAIGPFLLAFSTGCFTLSGGQLEAIDPPRPRVPGRVEYTVGDFEFTLDGGKMITSTKAGRNLSDEIFGLWLQRGFIEGFRYAPSGSFSGSADYHLTLSGSQRGRASVGWQILSMLTLLLIPYRVDTEFDIQYTLERVDSGAKHGALVADGFETWFQLLLVFATPFSSRGADETMTNVSNHLYQQLERAGAFDRPLGAAAGVNDRAANGRTARDPYQRPPFASGSIYLDLISTEGASP